MMKKRYNLATMVGLIILASALTFVITFLLVEQHFDGILFSEKSTLSRYSKIERVLSIIENEYVGEYDVDTLMDGAAAGIVAATGDRWSFYMTSDDYNDYMQTLKNSYVGIGTTVVYEEERGGILVVKVHPGSPAEKAGIAVQDLIVSVDGNMFEDVGYAELVDMVRGEDGTEVLLGVISQGDSRPHNITATRGSYLYNPVSAEILENDIGLIRIENFDERVAANFLTALENLLDAGVSGIIFDVRNNGGGLKDEMVQMLDWLCPEGTLFTMRDKNGNERVDKSDAEELNLPMAVIVNQGSYSAAEFFAAALQEYDKATIIGTGTSGKGYSQQTRSLGDGSAMNISTNEYFTPNGNSLIGVGIIPDIEVELDVQKSIYLLTADEDTQLKAAITAIRQDINTTE